MALNSQLWLSYRGWNLIRTHSWHHKPKTANLSLPLGNTALFPCSRGILCCPPPPYFSQEKRLINHRRMSQNSNFMQLEWVFSPLRFGFHTIRFCHNWDATSQDTKELTSTKGHSFIPLSISLPFPLHPPQTWALHPLSCYLYKLCRYNKENVVFSGTAPSLLEWTFCSWLNSLALVCTNELRESFPFRFWAVFHCVRKHNCWATSFLLREAELFLVLEHLIVKLASRTWWRTPLIPALPRRARDFNESPIHLPPRPHLKKQKTNKQERMMLA